MKTTCDKSRNAQRSGAPLSILFLSLAVGCGSPTGELQRSGDDPNGGSTDGDDGSVTGTPSGCIPNCQGRVCGDDECGDVCGPNNCGPNGTCNGSGQCECISDCTDRVCGPDGCGGTCAPDNCPDGEFCDSSGQCMDPATTFDVAEAACWKDGYLSGQSAPNPLEELNILLEEGYRGWILRHFTFQAPPTGPVGIALTKNFHPLVAFEEGRRVMRVFRDGSAMPIVISDNRRLEPIDVSPDGSFALTMPDNGASMFKIPQLDPCLGFDPSANLVFFSTINTGKNQRIAFDSTGWIFTASHRITPNGNDIITLTDPEQNIYGRGDVGGNDTWFVSGNQRLRVRDANGNFIDSGQIWENIVDQRWMSGQFDFQGNYWVSAETTNGRIAVIDKSYWDRLAAQNQSTADMRALASEVRVMFTGIGSIEDHVIDPWGTVFATDETNDVIWMFTKNDRDGDQITDDWETAHGFDPDDFSDAFTDPDGDGLLVLEEYQLSTLSEVLAAD